MVIGEQILNLNDDSQARRATASEKAAVLDLTLVLKSIAPLCDRTEYRKGTITL